MNYLGKNKKKNGGFLVLTMVLLVSATVLIVVTGVLLRSIGEMSQSTDSEKSHTAWSTANACGEYALRQLMASTTGSVGWYYLGGESSEDINLDVNGETCYIYPVGDLNGDKIIMASSTVSVFTKKIKIVVATNTPSVLVRSWKEVADF
jgi:hypothetical protein